AIVWKHDGSLAIRKWNAGTAWMLPRLADLIVAAFSVPFLGRLLDQCELNLLFDRIDTVHQHTNSLSHAECLACALANDFASVLVEHVAVVDEGIKRDQALHEHVREFDEEAEFGDANDEAVEVFADAVLHEFRFLPLHQFA